MSRRGLKLILYKPWVRKKENEEVVEEREILVREQIGGKWRFRRKREIRKRKKSDKGWREEREEEIES